MTSRSPWSVVAALSVIAAVFLIGAGVVVLFAPVQEPTRQPARQGGLSGPGADRINDYCRTHDAVIDEMPQHPDTAKVLEGLVTLWRADTGGDTVDTLRDIVLACSESPLALAALDRYLTEGGAPTLCASLIEQKPDTRAACMALDKLVQANPGQATEYLAAATGRSPDLRVGVFALVLQGERAAERGDSVDAARRWLQAWIKDPKRARPLYDRLSVIWLQAGDWHLPFLLPTKYLEDPVLTPVKQYALAALDEQNLPFRAVLDLFRRAGRALQANDVDTAVVALGQALQAAESLSGEQRAYFGLSAFFLGADTNFALSLDPRQSFRAKRLLAECRRQCLDSVLANRAAIPGELRALYAVQAANRMLQDAQVRPALSLLDETWRDSSISDTWRERAVESLATIAIEEQADYGEAARAYAAYSATQEGATPALILKAAQLYYKSDAYDLSLAQLDRLTATEIEPESRAAETFLRSLVLLKQGKESEAIQLLEKVAGDYPTSPVAPEALYYLGSTAMARKQGEEARAHYESLVARYPQWSRVEEVKLKLASLTKPNRVAP